MFCECRNIQVTFGRSIVLDVEHLAIPAGQITAVVGHNGSGKTTLLEVLSMLRKPTRGTLELWGSPARMNDRELRRTIVMVMHPGYLFRGNVWDSVLYGLRARGIRWIDARRRASEALAMVNLSLYARRDIAELSAGERQRVNLARAMVIQPKALLLDEPMANVDTHSVTIISDLLQRLRDKNGFTIVQTTPENNGFDRIADRIIELTDGQVVKNAALPGVRDLG